jgi:hypothetical protein
MITLQKKTKIATVGFTVGDFPSFGFNDQCYGKW